MRVLTQKSIKVKFPLNHISYFDMNNLNGWAMSSFLPYGGFKWLKNIDNFDVNSVIEKSPIGYILDVDLEYPEELHVLHIDYSLAPEKLAIPYDMLSNYCKKIADEYGIKVSDVTKLVPNLGTKLKQSDWMKKYVDFNTQKRTNAANNFEKDFFKLMINSLYGKTIEIL